jgi:hypothetical protein
MVEMRKAYILTGKPEKKEPISDILCSHGGQ